MYFSYDIYHVYQRSNYESVKKYRPIAKQEESLKTLSEDCVAWITIDGTSIDDPIMQGEDNMEYLNKDPYGEYSLSGSIFLDARCSSDFSDAYSLVYGHHMEHGAMFGALDAYESPDYFLKHQTGTLILGDRRLAITFFAFLDTDVSDMLVFAPSENEGPLASINEKGVVYFWPEEEPILCLSTCQDSASLKRTCLFAVIEGEND